MIYIASPYSSPLIGQPDSRFIKVRQFCINLLEEGLIPFSPIVYAHEMAGAGGMPTDAATWLRFNTDMLRHAEAMFVLCLPGWKESKGVTVERKQAKALFIETTYFNPDFTPSIELL